MRKLHMLTAAASILVALSGPSFAAKRTQQTSDANSAYAAGSNADRSGAYYYGPRGGASYGAAAGAQGFGGAGYSAPQGNLPYPDRPYGDPDRW